MFERLVNYFSREKQDVYCQKCGDLVGDLSPRDPHLEFLPDTRSITKGNIDPSGRVYCSMPCTPLIFREMIESRDPNAFSWWYETSETLYDLNGLQKAIKKGELVHFSKLERTFEAA